MVRRVNIGHSPQRRREFASRSTDIKFGNPAKACDGLVKPFVAARGGPRPALLVSGKLL
jgi:hypothetical protein